jgi:cell division protein FtsQ
MSPVAISADRRFHRAHVKPARRRGRLNSLLAPVLKLAAVMLVALLVVYRGGALVAQAKVLRIDQIVVSGNGRVSRAEVLSALHGMEGENIVLTDLNEWRARLLASAWIRDASFRRSLPSTIEVTVAEREPIGVGRVKGQLYVVDERGAVIDEYGPKYGDLDLPIIDGLAAPAGVASETDDPHGALAARLLLSLRTKPAIAHRVSQIDVSDAHNAAVIVTGDSALIYLGEDRFIQRLESYLGLATALRERVSDIDYVDLRFDDRIYVRPLDSRRAAAASGPASRPTAVSRTNSPRR